MLAAAVLMASLPSRPSAQVLERIVAIVGPQVITLSDARAAVALGLLPDADFGALADAHAGNGPAPAAPDERSASANATGATAPTQRSTPVTPAPDERGGRATVAGERPASATRAADERSRSAPGAAAAGQPATPVPAMPVPVTPVMSTAPATPATVVERLVRRELMRAEIERYGVAAPEPESVEARIAVLRQRFATPAAFAAALATHGLSEARLRAWIADDQRIAQYIRQRFDAAAQPTDEDVLQYYQSREREFTAPDGRPRPFTEARDEARRRLQSARRQALIDDWVAGLMRRTEIVILRDAGAA